MTIKDINTDALEAASLLDRPVSFKNIAGEQLTLTEFEIREEIATRRLDSQVASATSGWTSYKLHSSMAMMTTCASSQMFKYSSPGQQYDPNTRWVNNISTERIEKQRIEEKEPLTKVSLYDKILSLINKFEFKVGK